MAGKLLILVILPALIQCSKAPAPVAAPEPVATTAPAAVEPRVASVTPAGTDLLIGIGAADHLVAVSNFDADRPGTIGKPKIGDYQTIDWEKLVPLHPQILILFYAADRIPPAIQSQCDALHIQIFNVKVEQLADIYWESERLGVAVGEEAKAQAAVAALRAQLDAVKNRVAGLAPVRTIIVTADSGLGVAGPNTFLDEILTIAGGTNVAAGLGRRYSNVDREMLTSMAPDAVLQLIPDGDKTPQVLEQARQFWQTLPELPAVKNHAVHFVTDSYAEQAGYSVGLLAGEFADLLHPETK